MDKITVISDKEFETRFGGDAGYDDCMFSFKGAYAVACRSVEMYKLWKDGNSFDDILREEWEINFDICFEGENLYFPQSAYDFCKEAFMSIDDNFCDDRE